MDDEQAICVSSGRAALRAKFRWSGGHADVWRIFRDAVAFERVVAGMVAPFTDRPLTAVAGIESRGFLLGGAAAMLLGVGFVGVRKDGALFPGAKERVIAGADYRGKQHALSVQRDSLGPDDRVLLVDDWAETGSQAEAVRRLVEKCGAELMGTSVMVDQLDDTTRQRLGEVVSLVRFEELPPLAE